MLSESDSEYIFTGREQPREIDKRLERLDEGQRKNAYLRYAKAAFDALMKHQNGHGREHLPPSNEDHLYDHIMHGLEHSGQDASALKPEASADAVTAMIREAVLHQIRTLAHVDRNRTNGSTGVVSRRILGLLTRIGTTPTECGIRFDGELRHALQTDARTRAMIGICSGDQPRYPGRC